MPLWTRRPEVLLCPQIPKPLHGVAPRVLLGDSWWNETRQAAYRSTNYHCVACGVPKSKARFHLWLEGHELYETDYMRGRLTYLETVPLCNCCHMFIHRGRLEWLLSTRRIVQSRYVAVIQHGESVLEEAGLVKPPPYKGFIAPWSDWRMVVFGKEYPPKYASWQEWKQAMESYDG